MKLRQLMMLSLLIVVSLTFTGCGGNMAMHEQDGSMGGMHMEMNK
ncbi:YgdI/YgdR family lipoprotein [Tumebacillus flagellatus]|nr:YgdI/YgdR family lipoprotein [Tumebacillus flagellatus]